MSRILIQCSVKARIRSDARSSWTVAEPGESGEAVRERDVHLEIQGSDRHGYHLVMSPEGLFTADHDYATKEQAIEAALEIFGAPPDGWTTANVLDPNIPPA